jgi:NAD+ synthase (glutamine-hydrolysing)
VEDDRTVEEIVAMGFEAATVRRVVGLVDRAEYKRRQAAPGVKITPRAFGRDRRFPLASRWKG